MTPDRATEVVNQARHALQEIAAVKASAPDRVRVAYRLGIRKTEISKLSGLARATVDRYLGYQS